MRYKIKFFLTTKIKIGQGNQNNIYIYIYIYKGNLKNTLYKY